MAAVGVLLGTISAVSAGAGILYRARAHKSFSDALAAARAREQSAPPSPAEVERQARRRDDVDALARKLTGLPLTRHELRRIAAKLESLVGKYDRNAVRHGSTTGFDSALAEFVADTKAAYSLSDADSSRLEQIARGFAAQQNLT